MGSSNGGVGTFLFGGVIGAALGILFAPASGIETREFLKEKAQAYLDNADVINDSVRDRAVELYSTASGYAGDASDQLREKIEAARVRLNETVQGASEAAIDSAKQVENAASAAVDAAVASVTASPEAAPASDATA